MEDKPVSEWAIGFALFAGIMMVMIGIFQAFQGLAAILEDKFYVVAPNYVYQIDATVWGWIHLVLGALAVVAGFFIFSGQLWARIVGIGFAVLNAVTQFLFLPYYPVWSLIMITMDVFVIWALCVYNKRAVEQGMSY
ncbi:hypothetical protein Pta02_03960 [Planobispora takensis]|uniref:DUF7144 domain-containing protein n=1 Tax=Planobispora takensis TaxID=1367882 RepID=A0A8J3WRQ6_9ACTN|nr:hypothetical protein Pta02_03960 [Planobispora takensis]